MVTNLTWHSPCQIFSSATPKYTDYAPNSVPKGILDNVLQTKKMSHLLIGSPPGPRSVVPPKFEMLPTSLYLGHLDTTLQEFFWFCQTSFGSFLSAPDVPKTPWMRLEAKDFKKPRKLCLSLSPISEGTKCISLYKI